MKNLVICALLGNFSKATLINELQFREQSLDQALSELEMDPPCKNNLCQKFVNKENTKNENWVQDLNDSVVENKDSQVSEEPPKQFKKKHHFRKEHTVTKKAKTQTHDETSQKAQVSQAAHASPETDGNSDENDDDRVPKRKNRKGRQHSGHKGKRHHSGHHINHKENPTAHERDQSDRYHDTGVPHDLESEIHRSTEGLEGDNFYRQRRSNQNGNSRRHHDLQSEHLEREIYDETSGLGGDHYADQFERRSYQNNYRRSGQNYNNENDRPEYRSDNYGSHDHVLRRADDVLRSVNRYNGNTRHYYADNKNEKPQKVDKSEVKPEKVDKSEKLTKGSKKAQDQAAQVDNESNSQNDSHGYVPKKKAEAKKSTKTQKKKNLKLNEDKVDQSEQVDEQEDNDSSASSEKNKKEENAEEEPEQESELQMYQNVGVRFEPEWGHNTGNSYENGPNDHFYHGKASPFSVISEDVQLNDNVSPLFSTTVSLGKEQKSIKQMSQGWIQKSSLEKDLQPSIDDFLDDMGDK